MTELTLI